VVKTLVWPKFNMSVLLIAFIIIPGISLFKQCCVLVHICTAVNDIAPYVDARRVAFRPPNSVKSQYFCNIQTFWHNVKWWR